MPQALHNREVQKKKRRCVCVCFFVGMRKKNGPCPMPRLLNLVRSQYDVWVCVCVREIEGEREGGRERESVCV